MVLTPGLTGAGLWRQEWKQNGLPASSEGRWLRHMLPFASHLPDQEIQRRAKEVTEYYQNEPGQLRVTIPFVSGAVNDHPNPERQSSDEDGNNFPASERRSKHWLQCHIDSLVR